MSNNLLLICLCSEVYGTWDEILDLFKLITELPDFKRVLASVIYCLKADIGPWKSLIWTVSD